MNLLLLVLVVTFLTAGRARGTKPMIRMPYLVALCGVTAIAYLSQKVV